MAYGLAYLTRTEGYPNGRPEALFGSLLISWVMGSVISALVYRFGSWRRKASHAL